MESVGRRVLIIVQNLPVPFDRRVWLEATTLTQNGFAVSVICPKLKGFNRSRERIEGVDIYRYPMPFDPSSKLGFLMEFAWAWLATGLLSIRVALFGRGFDGIHACNPPETYWVLGRLWRLTGKRFVFDHHDLSPEMFAAKFGNGNALIQGGLRFMEHMTFKTADVVLATNESHRSVALERGGMDAQDVFVVRSGPDMKRLSVFDTDPTWRRGKDHLIVYLGDISPQDGVDGLVRIADILSSERTDFHVVVVGGGSAWEELRDYSKARGVQELFTFTGVVSDEILCRVLSSATIAVDPAPRNQWTDKSTMNKILEYMYFGLPIVAYPLTETIRSAGEAVAVASSGTETEFARLVSELLDDGDRRQRMSEIGRARLVDHLSWEHSVPSLLDAYKRVVGTLDHN